MTDSPSFSLLISVYAGDRADHLRLAVRSAVEQQTLQPDEVVIVRDGPVADDIAVQLDMLAVRGVAGVPVTVVPLERNQGLAAALTVGLEVCRHDVIARMDADDVALPERFARQLPLIAQGADLVGSGMLEFENDTAIIVGRRVPPVGHEHISRYARLHDPFNHPTVVYRRDAVRNAGGYRALHVMEDYSLFARMMISGARVENLAEPLVMYRVGLGAYARRGGWRLLKAELALQRELRSIGFTTRTQAVRNVLIRGGYRLVPLPMRRTAYRRLVSSGAIARLRRSIDQGRLG